MASVTGAGLENGQVVYKREVEATPATSRTQGNVTINDAARSGVPAHYEVTFMIQVQHEAGDLAFRNVFHWTEIVLNKDENAPYRAIEDEAARQIVPALRAVADRIQAEIDAFDQRKKSDQNDA